MNDPLEKLRQAYAEKLPEKMNGLRDTFAAVRAAGTAEARLQAIQSLRDQAHKLAGSGTTFGFPGLSEQARIFEHYCDGCLNNPDSLPDDLVTRLGVFLDSVIESGSVGTRLAGHQSAAAVPLPTSNGQGAKRVLVVDDTESMAKFAELILSHAGLTVAVETDPTQVIGSLGAFRPDLILLDLHMPGLDGIELAGQIKQISDFADVPILFLSAEEDKAVQQKALDAGGAGFIGKPLNARQLTDAVRPYVDLEDDGE